jgi:hypothetical protein
MTRHLRFLVRALVVGVVAATAACDHAAEPTAPIIVPVPPSTGPIPAARGAVRPEAAATLTLDDAIERIIPTLGDASDVAATRGAFIALRAAVPADGAALGVSEAARFEAAIVGARGALARLVSDAAVAPERDALELALDALADATT